MIKLERAGIYIFTSSKMSFIGKVVGFQPSLRVVSGIRLNDFVATGTVVHLKEESKEIQEYYAYPDTFVVELFPLNSIAMFEVPKMYTKGVTIPVIDDTVMQNITYHYLENRNIPGRGANATMYYITMVTALSMEQARIVILQLQKKYANSN